MFGSKIRSWMENHIVRPRKKGHKNKNVNSNNLAITNGAQNGHKGNSYSIFQSDAITTTSAAPTNSVSSPARRSEVSPIQSHTGSRFGWQSPKRESVTSPMSDHLLYVHNIKAHTLSSPSPLSTTATTIVSSTLTQSTLANKNTKTVSPNSMLRKSSFTFNEDNDSNPSQKLHCSKIQHPSHSPQVFKGHCSHNNTLSPNSNYNKPYVNTNSQNEINVQNNNRSHKSTNKSPIMKQAEPASKTGSRHQNRNIQNVNDNRYGKILPSKRFSEENFNTSVESYDNINANVQKSGGQEHSSNNNNDGINNITSPTCNGQAYPQQHYYPHIAGSVQCKGAYDANRGMLRTNRYNGNTLMAPSNNHPLAHVINSLSSPESAYSTGYSTDGTSPGATYTPPEYYINMRTGTHYFPKGVNALAIETTRYKFGLNKIEEMSPQEPLPNNHRRTESFDLGQNNIPGFGVPDATFLQAKSIQSSTSTPQNSSVIYNYKGFESPSPRQRCRIRTNPWYSTTDTSSSGNSTFLTKKIEVDASSSSSGIKSSSDAGASDMNQKNDKSSDSDETSSSTEVEAVKRTFSPSTIRRRKVPLETSKSEAHPTHTVHQDSDEDATLNEMMGKFDESYVYEKETDILSDSDPTDCASDLDTGQDAGDECDTDDLLDIDFIDNGSMQEIVEKECYKNTGSCSYFNYPLERRSSRIRRSRKQNEDNHTTKRRKRLMKTRKKSIESKEKLTSSVYGHRESRSLGGTPVCLRRNQSADAKKTKKISSLFNRSNSLTLTEVHAIQGRAITIAESEKALMKADMEADVKYKQLIHEAETILVSMKTTALRETPVGSPSRRICNLPANKRVEILRNCEADIKREIMKQQTFSEVHETTALGDGILINKRLEILKQETNSAPNSPKCGRLSPRKTHVTNFINQNTAAVEIARRSSITESTKNKNSTQLQSHMKRLRSPNISPSIRRRVKSQSARVSIYSDSDSEDDSNLKSTAVRKTSQKNLESELNGNTKTDFKDTLFNEINQSMNIFEEDISNKDILLETEKLNLYDEFNYTDRNIQDTNKHSIMSFRSIDMGNQTSMHSYCPQSEPLKRKIYKGSSSFERIKKSLDLESEIPKKALLKKISNLRRERQTRKEPNAEGNLSVYLLQQESSANEDCFSSNISIKQQLILNTIEDLKRSLEDQSVELCGLNDSTAE